jgi:hypothetical protein
MIKLDPFLKHFKKCYNSSNFILIFLIKFKALRNFHETFNYRFFESLEINFNESCFVNIVQILMFISEKTIGYEVLFL